MNRDRKLHLEFVLNELAVRVNREEELAAELDRIYRDEYDCELEREYFERIHDLMVRWDKARYRVAMYYPVDSRDRS